MHKEGVGPDGVLPCEMIYLSQPPDGVRSSPAQLLKGEIQGYMMELRVRLENALFNTQSCFMCKVLPGS